MKALLLAAGYGKRLQPITDRMPKAMVPVNGCPLLVNALDHLTHLGIKEIGIVVGHMADYIRTAVGDEYKGATIVYYENERYRETNNVVSLYKAADFCNDDMLMLECDLYYREELLERLLEGQGECSILVSPFNPATMDGTVILTEGETAKSLVLGKWQDENFDYSRAQKTVNLYKFTKDFLENKYMPLIRWYVEHMGENCYYEKVLGMLLYLQEVDARIVTVPESMWCEIDDQEDLERACRKFGNSAESGTALPYAHIE